MAASASPPNPPAPLLRLRRRRDFLAAARARKWTTPGFVLQARPRAADEPARAETIRVGYTASKKVGGAVIRNRAKRRLRALAEPALGMLGRPGWDYVLIARAETTAARPFATLAHDLEEAVARVHERRRDRAQGRRAAPASPKASEAAP